MWSIKRVLGKNSAVMLTYSCEWMQHLDFDVVLSPTQSAVCTNVFWIIITHLELISLAILQYFFPFLLVFRLNISDSDMLTITDGDEVTTRILGRYVGGSSPFKLSSTTPDLTVTFHSDPAGLVFGKGEGFIINYIGDNNRLRSIFTLSVKKKSIRCKKKKS